MGNDFSQISENRLNNMSTERLCQMAEAAINSSDPVDLSNFNARAPLGRLSDAMLMQLAEASMKSSNSDALFYFKYKAPLGRLSDAMLTQLAEASMKSSAPMALYLFNANAPLGRLSDAMLTQLAEASMKSSDPEALSIFNCYAPLGRLSDAMLTQLAEASMKSSDSKALPNFINKVPLGSLPDGMLTQLAEAASRYGHTTLNKNKSLDKISPASWKKHAENALSSNKLATFFSYAPLDKISPADWEELAKDALNNEQFTTFVSRAPLDNLSDGMLTQLLVTASMKDSSESLEALIRRGFDQPAMRSVLVQGAAKSLSARGDGGVPADKLFYGLLQKNLTAPEKTILLKAAIAETGKRTPSRTEPLFAFLEKDTGDGFEREAIKDLKEINIRALRINSDNKKKLKTFIRQASKHVLQPLPPVPAQPLAPVPAQPLPSAPPLPTVPEHVNFTPSAPPAPVGTAIWATSPPALQGSFHHTPPAKPSFFQKMKAKFKKKPAAPAPQTAPAQPAYPPSVISDPSEPRPFHTTSGAAQGFCMATARTNTEAQYETEIGDIAFYAESRGAQSFQKLGGIISSVEHTLSELYRDHQGLAMGLAVDHNRHSFTAVILQAVAQAVAGAANSIPVVGGAVAAGAAQAGQAVHAKDHAVQARKFEKFGVFGLVNDHNQRNVFSPDAQQDNARAVFHEVACCLGLELADQLKTGKTQQIGGVLNEGKQYAERIVTAILNADQNTLDGMKSVADLSLFVLEKALSNPVTAWNNQPAIRERAVKLYKKYIEKGKVPFCEYSRTDTGHSVRGGNIRLASLRTRPSTVLNANQNISPLSSPRYGAGSSRMPVV